PAQRGRARAIAGVPSDRARSVDHLRQRGLSCRRGREDDLRPRAARVGGTQLEAAVEALLDHAPDEVETQTGRTPEPAPAALDAKPGRPPRPPPPPRGETGGRGPRRAPAEVGGGAVLKRIGDQLVRDESEP